MKISEIKHGAQYEILTLIAKEKARIIKQSAELHDTAIYTESANIMREGNREIGAMKAIAEIERIIEENLW